MLEQGTSGARTAYEARLAEREGADAALEAVSRRISNGRLLLALVAVAALYLGAFAAVFHPAWALVPGAAFVALALHHDRLIRRQARCRRAAALYRDGLERLDGRWPGRGANGEGFAQAAHPYALDLDVIGHGSLFELLAGARTTAGEETLARWLLAPAPPAEVRRRHVAVAELSHALDLREEVALLGEEVRAAVEPGLLRGWGEAPQEPVPAWWTPASFASSALTLAGLVAWAAGAPLPAFGLPLLLHSLLHWRLRHWVARVATRVERPAEELDVLAGLLARLEQEHWNAPLLAALQERIGRGGVRASARVARLERLAGRLEWRENLLFRPVDFLLLFGFHLGRAVERWREQNGRALADWLAAVGEVEALLALARHTFEHADDAFPELLEGGEPRLEATGLAHPLLGEDAVRNDLALGGDAPRVLIVSGSNMSGKSTLLRALGLNVALALAGGPVRARALRLTPLALGASIRVVDSVLEGRSRFFAEVGRLKTVVDLADRGAPLLFLLDELLGGTNSHDRRIAAEVIVRHLVERGALGLLTTHDLALAELEATLAPALANVHFEDVLEEDEVRFDYRLHAGVVTHSNALELMRTVGLPVPRRGEAMDGEGTHS